MGWWKMNPKTGGIACSPPSDMPDDSKVINAIPGRDKMEDHYGGDQPADIMGEALRKIAACWQETWGRPPCIKELDGVFAFCMGRHRAEGKYKQ